MGFEAGSTFKLGIIAQEDGYKVTVDDEDFTFFEHRLVKNIAKYLHVGGKVTISQVKIICNNHRAEATDKQTTEAKDKPAEAKDKPTEAKDKQTTEAKDKQTTEAKDKQTTEAKYKQTTEAEDKPAESQDKQTTEAKDKPAEAVDKETTEAKDKPAEAKDKQTTEAKDKPSEAMDKQTEVKDKLTEAKDEKPAEANGTTVTFLSTVNNLEIPFAVPLNDGDICEGLEVDIFGRVTEDGDTFSVNFQSNDAVVDHPDTTVHLSVRPTKNAIVRNHKKDGKWGKEERKGVYPTAFKAGSSFKLCIIVKKKGYKFSVDDEEFVFFDHRLDKSIGKFLRIGGFPFKNGEDFKMHIIAQEDYYRIEVNEKQFTDFQHRIPVDYIDYLNIVGDITLSQVIIN